jgi:hypothetical protein
VALFDEFCDHHAGLSSNSQPVVRSKPIELILMKSIKQGAGEDLLGERPVGDAYDAVTGALSGLVPQWLKDRLWSSHKARGLGGDDDDDLLLQTDTTGALAAAMAEAEASSTPGEDEDDEDLGMGSESNNAMLVQINAGLSSASRSAEAPMDGLDLMVVPLLVLGRWNLAANMQRLQGQSIPIIIPNARRTGGKHDVSAQLVVFPDTGNIMMPAESCRPFSVASVSPLSACLDGLRVAGRLVCLCWWILW